MHCSLASYVANVHVSRSASAWRAGALERTEPAAFPAFFVGGYHQHYSKSAIPRAFRSKIAPNAALVLVFHSSPEIPAKADSNSGGPIYTHRVHITKVKLNLVSLFVKYLQRNA